MAVDSTTAFQNVRDRSVSILPGEVLTTPETIQRLQISDKEALSPANVIQFLAGQFGKYDEIVNRPLIKMESGEIPEYVHDERQAVVTALSRDEQTALSDWRTDARAMLTVQSDPPSGSSGGGSSSSSSSGGSGDLEKTIQQFIDDVAKNHPETLTKGAGLSGPDILGDMLSGEIFKDTEETKRKYQEILAACKDPESAILAMTWHQSVKTSAMMGKAFEALKFHQDGLAKLQADMDLHGKTMSQAQMMEKNIEFSKYSTDTNQIYQVIQQGLSKYEQTFTMGNSLERSAHDLARTIIGNYKT